MASMFSLDNPILWVQVHLKGGWQRIALFVGMYVFAMLAFTIGAPQLTELHLGSPGGWVCRTLLAIQGFMMIFVAAGRIGGAIRTDVASGIIESHRLMSLTPGNAIVGYMFGPAVTPILIFAVNVVLGGIVTFGSSMSQNAWLLANGIIFTFAIFIWTMTISSALINKSLFGTGIAFAIGICLSRGFITVVMPALIIIGGPIIGPSVMGLPAPERVVLQYLASLAAQLGLGAIFLIGATRKYRWPHTNAFPPDVALTALVLWVGLSVIGIARWDDFRPGIIGDAPRQVMFIGALISSTLLALLPITQSIIASRLWKLHHLRFDPMTQRRPPPPVPMLVLAIGVIFGLFYVAPHEVSVVPYAIPHTAVAIATMLTTIGFGLRIIDRFSSRVGGQVLISAVMVWLCAPVLVDFMHQSLIDARDSFSWLCTICPLGVVIVCWTDLREPCDPAVGVVAQLGLAILTVVTYYGMALRDRRARAARVGGAGEVDSLPVSARLGRVSSD